MPRQPVYWRSPPPARILRKAPDRLYSLLHRTGMGGIRHVREIPHLHEAVGRNRVRVTDVLLARHRAWSLACVEDRGGYQGDGHRRLVAVAAGFLGGADDPAVSLEETVTIGGLTWVPDVLLRRQGRILAVVECGATEARKIWRLLQGGVRTVYVVPFQDDAACLRGYGFTLRGCRAFVPSSR